MTKRPSKLIQYRNTSAYERLMTDHDLDDEGIWQVYGEDPNCDLGGSHISPFLGLFSGKLADIIAYAVELPNFWEWGAGGEIKKLSKPIPITANSVELRANDMERIEQLTTELAALKKKNGIR